MSRWQLGSNPYTDADIVSFRDEPKTTLGQLLKTMLESGMNYDQIAEKLPLIAKVLDPPAPPVVDPRIAALEKRRAYDRNRKKKLPSNWVEITYEVFERDGFTCVYCGADDRKLHCDHVIPLSRGGPSEPSNLVTACDQCNIKKNNRTPEEWGKPLQ